MGNIRDWSWLHDWAVGDGSTKDGVDYQSVTLKACASCGNAWEESRLEPETGLCPECVSKRQSSPSEPNEPRRVRIYDPEQGTDALSSGDLLDYDTEDGHWHNLMTGQVDCFVCGLFFHEETLNAYGVCPACASREREGSGNREQE